TDEGWDDWPPIFTPMFAMYHGSYGHTLETPRLGAATSKAAHVAAVWGALKFASQNRMEMVLDQMEIFRRGFFDEPQVPIGDEYGEQHEFLADFPEAYVIPTGSGRRRTWRPPAWCSSCSTTAWRWSARRQRSPPTGRPTRPAPTSCR